MSTEESPITEWIKALPEGDSQAQRHVWSAFAERVAGQAKRYLNGVQRRDSDEDDVAVRVLNSLFRRMEDGRQEVVESRQDLWHLLLRMTKNKSAEEARRKLALKRGKGKVRGESAFAPLHDNSGNRGIDSVGGTQIDPRQAFEEAQRFTELLDSIEDTQLKQIVLLRMANHTDQEIADMLGCGKRTIQRRFEEIRTQLTERSGT